MLFKYFERFFSGHLCFLKAGTFDNLNLKELFICVNQKPADPAMHEGANLRVATEMRKVALKGGRKRSDID